MIWAIFFDPGEAECDFWKPVQESADEQWGEGKEVRETLASRHGSTQMSAQKHLVHDLPDFAQTQILLSFRSEKQRRRSASLLSGLPP